MLGHHWEKAEGVVVAKTAAKHQGSSATSIEPAWDFAVDVQLATGETFRAEVHPPGMRTDFFRPEVGETVLVEVDKNRKVRFDMSDPRRSVKAQWAKRNDAFGQILDEPAGTPAPLGNEEPGSAP